MKSYSRIDMDTSRAQNSNTGNVSFDNHLAVALDEVPIILKNLQVIEDINLRHALESNLKSCTAVLGGLGATPDERS